ncbi:MAG: methyltransferase type 12 [Burkholderiales bacterium]|nr:methyltransferase type 12 [Burkholderiales bacterium]
MSASSQRKEPRAATARETVGLVRARAAADARLAFLRGFLERPFEVASIVPSSRFLEQRIVKLAGVRSATSVVELGPGTGGTTRAILRAMPPDARLLGVEINPDFHALLSGIEDTRFTLHLGSAADLVETLAARGIPAPQAIISGIPFSTMRRAAASAVANAVASALAPGGRFVAYQFSDQVRRVCRPHLGKARVELELLNIPPVRVYQWRKDGAPQGSARCDRA